MYDYEVEKKNVFTEDGQVMFLAIRDNIKYLLELSGAVRLEQAIKGISGDSFLMIACIDRLVELGELEEITPDGKVTSCRVFIEN